MSITGGCKVHTFPIYPFLWVRPIKGERLQMDSPFPKVPAAFLVDPLRRKRKEGDEKHSRYEHWACLWVAVALIFSATFENFESYAGRFMGDTQGEHVPLFSLILETACLCRDNILQVVFIKKKKESLEILWQVQFFGWTVVYVSPVISMGSIQFSISSP